MCLYPKLIKNRKYVKNKKNGGNVPVCDDKRKLVVPSPCGECMECRKKIARDWQIRLLEDIRHNKNGKFINLTFSNESILKISRKIRGLTGYNLDNEIAIQAMRKFLERWRGKHKKSVRHWFITELGHGDTEHLHLHGILWTDQPIEEIQQKWKYGTVWQGEWVNEQTINYIIKYVHKKDKLHEHYKPIVLTSAGIGRDYLKRQDVNKNKYKKGATKETYTNRQGYKIAMPTYWRNKIYSEEEREELWVEKLDKQERWVGGEKIDISQGEEEYYKLLKYYQQKSERLGYGTGKINWEKREYENERRILKIDQRIKSASGGSGSGELESINDLAEGSIWAQMKPSKEWE